MHGVGVGEQEPVALRGACARGDRVIFAGPALGQGAGFDHSNGRERLGDRTSVVGGTIVYDENFKGDARLRSEGTQAGAQASLLVTSRYNHRDRRLLPY